MKIFRVLRHNIARLLAFKVSTQYRMLVEMIQKRIFRLFIPKIVCIGFPLNTSAYNASQQWTSGIAFLSKFHTNIRNPP